MIVTITIVSAWTARFTMPSWNSWLSASMSLVMRVITRPAFSPVKKSMDSRCRCAKTQLGGRRAATRRPCLSMRRKPLAIMLMMTLIAYSTAVTTSTCVDLARMPLSIARWVSNGPACIVRVSTSTSAAPAIAGLRVRGTGAT